MKSIFSGNMLFKIWNLKYSFEGGFSGNILLLFPSSLDMQAIGGKDCPFQSAWWPFINQLEVRDQAVVDRKDER